MKQMQKEISFKTFKHEDLICCVSRMARGNLNGYVGVPPEHKLHGKDYNDLYSQDINIDVHGGLTYSSSDFSPLAAILPDHHWFGFDTMHYNDISPIDIQIDGLRMQDLGTYRNMVYVTQQVTELARQLHELR